MTRSLCLLFGGSSLLWCVLLGSSLCVAIGLFGRGSAFLGRLLLLGRLFIVLVLVVLLVLVCVFLVVLFGLLLGALLLCSSLGLLLRIVLFSRFVLVGVFAALSALGLAADYLDFATVLDDIVTRLVVLDAKRGLVTVGLALQLIAFFAGQRDFALVFLLDDLALDSVAGVAPLDYAT